MYIFTSKNLIFRRRRPGALLLDFSTLRVQIGFGQAREGSAKFSRSLWRICGRGSEKMFVFSNPHGAFSHRVRISAFFSNLRAHFWKRVRICARFLEPSGAFWQRVRNFARFLEALAAKHNVEPLVSAAEDARGLCSSYPEVDGISVHYRFPGRGQRDTLNSESFAACSRRGTACNNTPKWELTIKI